MSAGDLPCARCGSPAARRWCPDCERAYDTWVRRYASDMIFPVLAGMVVVASCAVALPILGIGWLIGVAGAFGGFGTVGGIAMFNRWRRRRQFVLDGIPRASLMAPRT